MRSLGGLAGSGASAAHCGFASCSMTSSAALTASNHSGTRTAHEEKEAWVCKGCDKFPDCDKDNYAQDHEGHGCSGYKRRKTGRKTELRYELASSVRTSSSRSGWRSSTSSTRWSCRRSGRTAAEEVVGVRAPTYRSSSHDDFALLKASVSMVFATLSALALLGFVFIWSATSDVDYNRTSNSVHESVCTKTMFELAVGSTSWESNPAPNLVDHSRFQQDSLQGELRSVRSMIVVMAIVLAVALDVLQRYAGAAEGSRRRRCEQTHNQTTKAAAADVMQDGVLRKRKKAVSPMLEQTRGSMIGGSCGWFAFIAFTYVLPSAADPTGVLTGDVDARIGGLQGGTRPEWNKARVDSSTRRGLQQEDSCCDLCLADPYDAAAPVGCASCVNLTASRTVDMCSTYQRTCVFDFESYASSGINYADSVEYQIGRFGVVIQTERMWLQGDVTRDLNCTTLEDITPLMAFELHTTMSLYETLESGETGYKQVLSRIVGTPHTIYALSLLVYICDCGVDWFLDFPSEVPLDCVSCLIPTWSLSSDALTGRPVTESNTVVDGTLTRYGTLLHSTDDDEVCFSSTIGAVPLSETQPVVTTSLIKENGAEMGSSCATKTSSCPEPEETACSEGPCLNGAMCLDQFDGTYSCTCPKMPVGFGALGTTFVDAFEGDRCEHPSCEAWACAGTSLAVCTQCGAGRNDDDSDASTPCIDCPAGMYSDMAGATECSICSAGTYAAPGSVSVSGCAGCVAGKYDDDSEASTPCIDCPTGTYSDTVGATECSACFAGTYAAPGSASCVECVAGKYDDDSDASTPCIDCPVGTYSDTVGATECSACSAGTYAAPGLASVSGCVECAAGKYDGDSDASTPCIDCPAGTYSDFTGTIECSVCSAGAYSVPGSVSMSECVECVPGMYDGDSDTSTPCTHCPIDAYSDVAGVTGCSMCHPGTYSARENSTSATDCVYVEPTHDLSTYVAKPPISRLLDVERPGSSLPHLRRFEPRHMYTEQQRGSGTCRWFEPARGGPAAPRCGGDDTLMSSCFPTLRCYCSNCSLDLISCPPPPPPAPANPVIGGGGMGSFGFFLGLDLGNVGASPSSSMFSQTGVTSADFNGDGMADALVVNYGVENELRLGDGEGNLTSTLLERCGDRSQSVTSADFNGDALADALVVNGGQPNELLLGNGQGAPHTHSSSLYSQPAPCLSQLRGSLRAQRSDKTLFTRRQFHIDFAGAERRIDVRELGGLQRRWVFRRSDPEQRSKKTGLESCFGNLNRDISSFPRGRRNFRPKRFHERRSTKRVVAGRRSGWLHVDVVGAERPVTGRDLR